MVFGAGPGSRIPLFLLAGSVVLLFAPSQLLMADDFPNSDVAVRRSAVGGGSASSLPAICGDGSGHLFSVYLDRRNGAGADLYFTHSADGGTTWQKETRLDPEEIPGWENAESVSLACDPGGHVFILFSALGSAGVPNVYTLVSHDYGALWKRRIWLDDNEPWGLLPSVGPQVCSDGAGNVYAGWLDTDQVLLRRSADRGDSWSKPVAIDGGLPPFSQEFQLTCRSDGRLYAAWKGLDNRVTFNSSSDFGSTWEGALPLETAGAEIRNIRLRSAAGGAVFLVWEQDSQVQFKWNNAFGNPSAWQPAQVLNSGSQAGRPEFDSDGSSALTVVWEDGPGTRKRVLARDSTDRGASWSPITDISSAAFSGLPQVVRDRGTGSFAVWQDGRNGATDIYFCRKMGGEPWTVPIRLDGDAAGAAASSAPRILWDGPNRLVVVWEDLRNSPATPDTDLFANRSNDLGGTWKSSADRLDQAGGASASTVVTADAATDGQGNVFAVWSDRRSGSPKIYFNVSRDHGRTWGVNDSCLDCALSGSGQAPRIAVDGAGGVYVLFLATDGKNRLVLNRSLDNGATWLAQPVPVDHGNNPSFIGNGDLAVESGGRVFAFWEDSRNSPAGGRDWFFNRSIDFGLTWQSADIRLNSSDSPGLAEGGSSRIAADGTGRLYTVWAERIDGRGEVRINGSKDGGLTWWPADVRVDRSDSTDDRVTVAGDSSGGVVVAWQDWRNGNPDIYANGSRDCGANWLVEDRRLDPGLPGAASSLFPILVTSQPGRFHALFTEQADGARTLLSTTSLDTGTTWSGVSRVDTGIDSALASASVNKAYAAAGGRLAAAWVDHRSGFHDVFVNVSLDGGMTWSDQPYRADTFNGPGAGESGPVTLAFDADGWVLPVWIEHRFDQHQIRANSVCGFDLDHDGYSFGASGKDCDDADPSVWRVPTEIIGLTGKWTTGGVSVAWYSQDGSAGPSTHYDLVTGSVSQLRGDGDFHHSSCLHSDWPDSPYTDGRPGPMAPDAFYYLVRAANGCGVGSYGDSVLVPDPRDLLDGAGPCP